MFCNYLDYPTDINLLPEYSEFLNDGQKTAWKVAKTQPFYKSLSVVFGYYHGHLKLPRCTKEKTECF